MEVRQLMEESHLRFGNSCAARLYVKRENGGLGVKLVEEELDCSIAYTWCYVASRTDLLVPYQLAESLRASHKRSLTTDFQAVLVANGLVGRVRRTSLATIVVDDHTFFNATEAARAVSALIRARWGEFHLSTWRSKETAGRVLRTQRTEAEDLTELCYKDSFLWSARGWLSAEVLRNVWAVQEGALLTRASAAGRACMPHARGVCRMQCAPGAQETAEHIVSVCNHWRSTIMVERHDDVARVLYSSIRRKYKVANNVNTHVPHVLDMPHVVIYWNSPIWTSACLAHNRPDILVWDKAVNRIWIIEVSVSWYNRILRQEKR
ncbi:unnamed protein product, partial [Cylicostephanus goldi]